MGQKGAEASHSGGGWSRTGGGNGGTPTRLRHPKQYNWGGKTPEKNQNKKTVTGKKSGKKIPKNIKKKTTKIKGKISNPQVKKKGVYKE